MLRRRRDPDWNFVPALAIEHRPTRQALLDERRLSLPVRWRPTIGLDLGHQLGNITRARFAVPVAFAASWKSRSDKLGPLDDSR